MYSINRDTNQITPLQKHSFKDLRFREREHLQEWLAKHPEALGDLLIIQKEFDGFNNTRERLDLLALDRQGRIVDQIIPPPEASDYMIQLAEKSAVEETANSSRSKSYDRRQQYWKALFARFEEAGLSHLQGRVPASADAWISIKSGSSAFFYSLNVLKQEVRLQVNIESPNADRNSEVFEFLKTRKATIEAEYGSALVWYNPPNAKVCRIIDSYQIDTTDQSNWPDAIEWQQKRLDSILAAFSPYIDEIATL